MIMIHGKKAKKAPPEKAAKKALTPTERDAEDKRIAEMMYPTALEAAKAAAAAKGAAT